MSNDLFRNSHYSYHHWITCIRRWVPIPIVRSVVIDVHYLVVMPILIGVAYKRHLPACSFSFHSDGFKFRSLVIRRTRKLACYSEKVSFVRAQKMPESNVFRDPPGHRASFVNEWKMSFLCHSEENLRIS